MKHLLVLFGLLLLPGITHAQAFSPWVEAVLEKADEGLMLAASLPAPSSCEEEGVQSAIHANQGLFRQFVIPALNREMQSQSLRERTVCLENDKRLLELKLRDIQDAMDEAVRTCKLSGNKILGDNYEFLMRAYMVFSLGANDPTVKSDMLSYRYPYQDRELFDAGVSTPVLDTESTVPLCPYSTDYGVHSIAFIPLPEEGTPEMRSFGCDAASLQQIAISPLNEEAATLKEFMDRTQSLATDLYNTVSLSLYNIDYLLHLISGGTSPTEAPGAKPPPPHAALNGCLKPLAPDFGGDPKVVDAVLSAYPDYFEAWNLRDDAWGRPTYSPPPEQTLPMGMLHSSIVDYFLVQPNASVAIRSYVDKRERAGAERPLPEHLVSEAFGSFWEAINRGSQVIDSMKTISSNIERQSTLVDASDRDAMQRMQEASAPLEEAVQSLIEVTEEFLPKTYTPALTLFLARSCVDGHCQRTLDAVAQRTFNPYCHPYVSGKYKEEDAAKRCFCDPEVEETWDEWETYCSPYDPGQDAQKYENMQPMLVEACTE